MKFDFIEIGTSFFCTKGLSAGSEETGVLVEPVRPALARIPTKPNVRKLNVAVSQRSGQCLVQYLKPEFWDAFPRWLLGCVSMDSLHPKLKMMMDSGKITESMIQSDVVQCITLSELFDICDASEVGELKVDAEGMDYLILQPYFRDRPKIKPNRVIFEANVLTPERQNVATIEMFIRLGYQVVHRGRDVIVEKCQRKKKG